MRARNLHLPRHPRESDTLNKFRTSVRPIGICPALSVSRGIEPANVRAKPDHATNGDQTRSNVNCQVVAETGRNRRALTY